MKIKSILCSILFICHSHFKILASSLVKITHYNISVKLPETYDYLEIKSELTLSFEKTNKNIQLPIAIGNGFEGASVSHVKVKNIKGESMTFTQDSHIVNIQLPEKYLLNQAEKIIISYRLQKDNRGKNNLFAFEISDTLCHINAAITRTDNWYPRIDGTCDDRLPEYKLSIETSSKMEVMSSGQLTEVMEKDGRKTFYSSNYPGLTDRSLFFFIAPLRKTVKTFPDGFKVTAFIPNNSVDSSVMHITDVIYNSYKYFKKTFGEIPGNEYQVMAFPYGHSGLLNAMTAPMNLFTQPIRNNEIYFPSRGIIHEVSHTWWGNAVSANATDHYWLYEGFAKYSEILGIKEILNADVEKLSYIRLKYSILPYHDLMPSVAEGGKEDIRSLETASAYYYGAMTLKMAELAIGREKFIEVIRSYVKIHYGKIITTENFLEFMKENIPGKVYQLLKDHITVQGFARYRLEMKYLGGEKMRHYSIKITNTGVKTLFTTFQTENKLDTLWLQAGEVKLFDLKHSPPYLLPIFKIDPDTCLPVWEKDMASGGAMVFNNPKKEVVFYGVIPGSPFATAGISENTILIMVNDESVEVKTFEQLNQMLFQPPGKVLKLVVKKPNQTETTDVLVYYRSQ